MSAESEKLCQSFWTARFTRESRRNKKIFLTPASQLSYEANWGAGHERFEILVDEDVLKVSLSMCFYGGKWEEDADNQKI